MKLSHSMVSVIAIGAALVSAYAIGLVIRHTRTGAWSAAPGARETAEGAARGPAPGAGATKDTAAERARVKEKREQMLQTMGSLTKEEQEQFKDKVIKQFGGRRGGKPSGNLSPEEKRARKIKTQGPSPAAGRTPDANAPAAPQENADPRQSAAKAGATP